MLTSCYGGSSGFWGGGVTEDIVRHTVEYAVARLLETQKKGKKDKARSEREGKREGLGGVSVCMCE